MLFLSYCVRLYCPNTTNSISYFSLPRKRKLTDFPRGLIPAEGNDKLCAMKRLLILAALLAAPSVRAGDPPPLRVAYNYCTLSYTFAYASDAEWTAEIDRLARAGYNAALVTDGTFKVWQLVLDEMGAGGETIRAFLPDECARAWWLMANLTGEGGPLDRQTIDDDGARGRRICEQMRARGIEPILQGCTGMIPLEAAWQQPDKAAFSICDRVYGECTIVPQGTWGPYVRPPQMDPTCPGFRRLAALWYEKLEEVYGFRPKFLAGDLFHEGGRTDGIDVTAATRAVQAAQQQAFPGVTWVVQAWQRNPTAEVRAGLDPRYTLIEALVKDMSRDPQPMDFGDLPWIWCEVLNFGGNHGLYGNLQTFARLGACTNATFRGYGLLSEGLGTNPVCYDLFEEMMTRPAGSVMTAAELDDWLGEWVDRRYGFTNAPPFVARARLRLHTAWRILAATVYACDRCQEGTTENVMCAEPAWTANNVSTWGPTGGLWYDPARLEEVARLFDAARTELVFGPAQAFRNLADDAYDIDRQVRANEFRRLLPRLKDDLLARREFLRRLRVDAVTANCPWSGVPEQFRLEPQLARARARAGARGEAAFRRMVTTWADPKRGRTTLADYAHREYVELLRDYYLPRWEAFLAHP